MDIAVQFGVDVGIGGALCMRADCRLWDVAHPGEQHDPRVDQHARWVLKLSPSLRTAFGCKPPGLMPSSAAAHLHVPFTMCTFTSAAAGALPGGCGGVPCTSGLQGC